MLVSCVLLAASRVLDALMPQPRQIEEKTGFVSVDVPVSVVRAAVADAPANVAEEAYVLDISATGVTVTASSEKGERYARVTLGQLKQLSDGRIPSCRIVDWPQMKWRGFMNDCGRNYLDPKGIRMILDVMAAYKMNLFVWHLTDYHGWRLESKRYPQLQRPDTFLRQVGKYYTQDEFREMLAYARARGVTVVPELDVPGHTLAFRKAMKIVSMSAPETDRIVADLLDELCSLADAEAMPFVHLGTDEARNPEEKCPDEWVNGWARQVNRLGRKVVVWAPGIKLDKNVDVVEMAWHDNRITNTVSAVMDGARMYFGSWDPFDLLSRIAFTRPCRWDVGDCQMGAIACCWHDDNVGDDTLKLFRECMVFPAIVGFGESYWSGNRVDRPEFWTRLPSPGTPAFAAAETLERRMAVQRDKVVGKVCPEAPFPFVGQTQMRWSVRDGESGRLLATDVPQGTVWAFCAKSPKNALVPEDRGDFVFETWIKSPDDRTVGCWIELCKVNGVYGRDGVERMPDCGEWIAGGGEVCVNGKAIAPPAWKQPGLRAKLQIDVLRQDVPYSNDLLETPMVDEMFALREPVLVTFRQGWNHVAIRVPKKAVRIRSQTGMTFCPIEGTSEHPREVADFEYSAVPPIHAFVQLWGDNLVRGANPARKFRDIPVSEGHYYYVRTTPATEGIVRFTDAAGNEYRRVRLSEQRRFYPPVGATAAEVILEGMAELVFCEDPEPPAVPVPYPDPRGYDDRPSDVPSDRWQREIDAAAVRGGGTVRVPAGVWHVKPLVLKSDVTLELADGAVLLASENPDDYPPGAKPSDGKFPLSRRAFIFADGATNVTIRGKGVIDGRGGAFREKGKNMDGESQPQTLPRLMCFNRCVNLTLEDFTYRRGGSWGCHLRNCDGVTMRHVTCFNHVNATNDGIDIESRNVLIEDCDIDADDDAIAIKAESDPDFAVTNVVIRNCRLASMAYPFKIGTGSYADVRDILVENCRFPRTRMNHRFAWSKLLVGITNDVSGICGIGIQCVDGGRLENVTVRNVEVEGYGVPISVRLGRRHDPAQGKATFLRNVLIENVKAVAEGPTASSICGVPGLNVGDVTLRNVRIVLTGGVTAADVSEAFENESAYPSPNMFRSILPSCGLYVRHASNVCLEDVKFEVRSPDVRPELASDDAVVRQAKLASLASGSRAY